MQKTEPVTPTTTTQCSSALIQIQTRYSTWICETKRSCTHNIYHVKGKEKNNLSHWSTVVGRNQVDSLNNSSCHVLMLFKPTVKKCSDNIFVWHLVWEQLPKQMSSSASTSYSNILYINALYISHSRHFTAALCTFTHV